MESVTLITHPISLCAYVLLLVFGLMVKRKGNKGTTDKQIFYLAAFLAFLALVGGLLLTSQQINKGAPSSLGTSPRPQTPTALAGELQILQPHNDEQVEQTEIIKFRSGFTDLNHYVLVIPMQSPNKWIVDGPIKILRDGFSSGRALFGDSSVGVGQGFAISIVATKELLSEGVQPTLPSDARMSSQIKVTRIK